MILKLQKSSWILCHSPEKLKYVPLKLAQMENVFYWKKVKNIANKKVSLVNVLKSSRHNVQKEKLSFTNYLRVDLNP